jgi:hypothetical protein
MTLSRALAALAAASVLVAPVSSYAQAAHLPSAVSDLAPSPAPPAAPPAAVATDPTPAPAAPAHVRLREGTEVRFTLGEALSSATSAEGDEFEITTSDPIDLGNGITIPAGFRGRGEVTSVEKKGMMGKAGQLSVRLDYMRIGDTKVRLRSNQSHEGKSNQTNAIVLSLLVTPLFLLMHGKDATIPKGQAVTGYVDDDADISLPALPPT